MIRHFIIILAILLLTMNNSGQILAQGNTDNNLKKQEVKNTASNKILALSQTNLNTSTAKVGDEFSAKMMENLVVGNDTLVPSGSTVYGVVTKVKPPTRFSITNKDGQLVTSLNRIVDPSGQTISLEGKEINGVILSPYYQSFIKKTIRRAPTSAATSGTSISLNNATNLNGGVVYAITQGTAVVIGGATGFLFPDPGRSRFYTSGHRAFEATALGSAYEGVKRGIPAGIDAGDSIILNFDNATIAKIQDQVMYASATRPQTAIQIPTTTGAAAPVTPNVPK